MAPVVARSLNRLSRDAVIDLALQWLSPPCICTPYLLSNRRVTEADEEDYMYPPAESIDGLRQIYSDFKDPDSRIPKRNIIDRIVDGDWRRGLSLYQHATIDCAGLQHNDTALRWSALRLVPLDEEGLSAKEEDGLCRPKKKQRLDGGPQYPQVSPPTFLSSLVREISPLVKAHHHFHRLRDPYNLTIIRMYITPHRAMRPRRSRVSRRAGCGMDAGRVMYLALPDSCPYIYVSLSGSTGGRGRSKGGQDTRTTIMTQLDLSAMKKIILEAVPKALSRPQQRWAIESTDLTARSLRTMCELRGNQRPGAGGGAYSTFIDDASMPRKSPVDVQLDDEIRETAREALVEQRFGPMAGAKHAALDCVQATLRYESGNDLATQLGSLGSVADIGLKFSGVDVFSGVKKLAALGPEWVDLAKTPAWMTGEYGVSILTA